MFDYSNYSIADEIKESIFLINKLLKSDIILLFLQTKVEKNNLYLREY